MIIEAKAARDRAGQTDPRKRFEFNTPERLSRLPIYFALLITGIAVYLKSAFPANALANEGEDKGAEPSPSPRLPSDATAQVGPFEAEEIDETTTGSIDGGNAPNTISGSGIPWQTNFALPDPPSLAYASTFEPFSPQLAAFFPAAFSYTPSNDNGGPIIPGVDGPANPPIDEEPHHPGDDDDEDDDDIDPGEDPDDDDDDDEEPDNDNEPVNRAPIVSGPVRLADVFAGQVILIGLSELLFGASDPDGDILSINDITVSGGTLVQMGNGWSFATLPGMLGVITFTYEVSDGLLEVVQTAVLEIVRKQHILTPGNDIYVASPWDDDIDGLAGHDIIDARAGNDVVEGGAGNDHINGGDGDDHLYGSLGNDIIFGGNGNDFISGGKGDDRLFGDDGNDVIEGNDGDDQLFGGDGDDILDAGDGNDIAMGEAGDDALAGGDGCDTLSGGEGEDVLDGGAGDDDIEGNEGNDLIRAGSGDDVADGGDGDDDIAGESGDDQLMGGDGNDTLDGGAGCDTLDGGEGNDTLAGGTGDDIFVGGPGDDDMDGGEGSDALDYSMATTALLIDTEAGTASGDDIGNDSFTGIEEFVGGSGEDTFVVGAKATVLTGGRGDDLFIFTVTDNNPALSQSIVHEILDFVVGDRIRVADYDISRRAELTEEERFGELYDAIEGGEVPDLPIRVRHARYDDQDHTIIEADINRDDIYEISIIVDGVHLPVIVEHNY